MGSCLIRASWAVMTSGKIITHSKTTCWWRSQKPCRVKRSMHFALPLRRRSMTEPTLYELSSPGRIGVRYPKIDVPEADLPEGLVRERLPLPELAEIDVIRHFTHLSKLNYCIDSGLYPLGSVSYTHLRAHETRHD